jgi:uracil-DNA glycosylase family 4
MSSMSERDAAFLAEMGIGPLWHLRTAQENRSAAAEPAAAEQSASDPAPGALQPAAAPARRLEAAPAQPAPAAPASEAAWSDEPAAPVTDEQIAHMDWAGLRTAVLNCTRCGACKAGRKPVFGTGAQAAQWLVAAGASTAADEKARQPVAGDAGRLLDNMLAAVGLSRTRDAYVTNLVKCRPASASGGDRAPTAEEAAACRPYLERELALTGASTVLTLGQIAANGLLGKPLQEPLAGARGSVHALNGVPLVATLHPGELLRRGTDKALAWSDLCRAKAAHAQSG